MQSIEIRGTCQCIRIFHRRGQWGGHTEKRFGCSPIWVVILRITDNSLFNLLTGEIIGAKELTMTRLTTTPVSTAARDDLVRARPGQSQLMAATSSLVVIEQHNTSSAKEGRLVQDALWLEDLREVIAFRDSPVDSCNWKRSLAMRRIQLLRIQAQGSWQWE